MGVTETLRFVGQRQNVMAVLVLLLLRQDMLDLLGIDVWQANHFAKRFLETKLNSFN